MWSKNYSAVQGLPYLLAFALFFAIPAVVVRSYPPLHDEYREFMTRAYLRRKAGERTLGVLTKSIFYKGWGHLLPEEERGLYSRDITNPERRFSAP